MNILLEYLNIFGIYVDEPLPAIVTLSLSFLVLSMISLLNVINIGIYLLSIYIVSNERFLSKIPGKYVYIHKLLKYYKNIRIIFIIYEVILLLMCLSIIIYLNYSLVSPFIHIK